MALPIKSLPFYLTKQEFISINARLPNPINWLRIPFIGVLLGVLLTYLGGAYTGVTVGVLIVFIGAVMPFARRTNVQNAANHKNSQWAFTDVRTAEFFPDFLVIELSGGFMSRVPWVIVSRVDVWDQVLVMVIGVGQNVMVPLRAISSADDRNQIAQLLADKGLLRSGKTRKALETGYTKPLS